MRFLSLTFIFLFTFSCVSNAKDCSNPSKVISVGKSGRGRFRTIQTAINSIPINNTRWIHIRISAGNYSEKVTIPMNKPCIFLEGAGSSSTIVQWSDHQQTAQSYTFESNAPNVMAKGIAFENLYNHPPGGADERTLPALAGAVRGDKNAFYDCVFKGVQDTLLDDTGRHYYHNCYIQGETDFIFGKGQSIYENCTIYFKPGLDGRNGAITAQKRESIEETSGYVFNGCRVDGTGQTILGRAYGAYSRVIIANSYLSSVVDPAGWNAWNQHNLKKIAFVEEGNKGPGANKSKRVPWMKLLTKKELSKFLDLSYIDNEGWLSNQPSSFNSKKLGM